MIFPPETGTHGSICCRRQWNQVAGFEACDVTVQAHQHGTELEPPAYQSPDPGPTAGRLFAMERGLRIPQKERTKTTNSILVSLMNQLEKDKKSRKLGPEDNLYVEGFASNVFAKADKQDRAGRADLNTAKTFYAASIFFEVLNQFGELAPDIEQKLKYSIWKAADIRKALKEGRNPEPGPPGGTVWLHGILSSGFELEVQLQLKWTSNSNSRVPIPSKQMDP
ncbi:hypothetical protein KSP40_PGU005452 [Platanthera guangdongensis]|uniref:Vta1/callose synthase N-terminal domain-containing protein n=1 Tax=Platanthera guangdongensis TaxID=2320717 RepID=A0ABR2MKD3_9ASPA